MLQRKFELRFVVDRTEVAIGKSYENKEQANQTWSETQKRDCEPGRLARNCYQEPWHGEYPTQGRHAGLFFRWAEGIETSE